MSDSLLRTRAAERASVVQPTVNSCVAVGVWCNAEGVAPLAGDDSDEVDATTNTYQPKWGVPAAYPTGSGRAPQKVCIAANKLICSSLPDFDSGRQSPLLFTSDGAGPAVFRPLKIILGGATQLNA